MANGAINLRNSILGLIPKMQTDVKDIHQRFNSGLTRAIIDIPFITPAFGNDLLKANEAVLDRTGIFKKEFFYNSFKELFPLKEIINYDLLYVSEKLCKLDVYGFEVTIFDENDIHRLFGLTSFSPKNDARHNASFIRLLNKSKQVSVLKTFPSLLSKGNLLKRPDELYMYIDIQDQKYLEFDSSLHFVSNELEQLSSKYSDFETILLEELGVEKFDAVKYIQSTLSQHIHFNKLISETAVNINFWRFIFKYRKSIATNDKAKLANFNIITTDGILISLKECFLAGSYQTTYQIDEIASQIGLTGLSFISLNYVEITKELEDWRSLFYECGARRSEGWELYKINVKGLITGNKLTETNCLVITKFIFEVYRNNRSKFDTAENNVLKSLKLLTEKNAMQPCAACFFGNPQITQILPDYDVDNLVSQQYSIAFDKTTEQDWKVFLLAAGVTELAEADIVKKKFLKIFAGLPVKDIDTSVKIWRFIHSYSNILANDNSSKQKLKDIQLPLLNGTLGTCQDTTVYFVKEYSPKSDMEALLIKYHAGFVSPLLIDCPENIAHWRNLLIIAGVKETIATAGTGNLFEISHTENLINHEFAVSFWAYFQKHFKVEEINTNSKFRTTVINQNCIPCLDGGMKRPDQVFPNLELYKEQINDDSKIAACDFSQDVISFLGINTNLTVLENDNSFLKHLGNLGERFVYHQLKQENSNGAAMLTENEFGFVVGPLDKPSIEIIWNNKGLISADIRTLLDSGSPYDFAIKKDGVTDYIEVKTTFMQNNHFMMPESEWNCMLSHPQNYYVFRVNNAGSSPNISVRCLALDALLRGDIKPLDFPLTITI